MIFLILFSVFHFSAIESIEKSLEYLSKHWALLARPAPAATPTKTSAAAAAAATAAATAATAGSPVVVGSGASVGASASPATPASAPAPVPASDNTVDGLSESIAQVLELNKSPL